MCQLRRGTKSSPTTRLVTCTAVIVSKVSTVGDRREGRCYRVVRELCSGHAEQSAGRAEGEAADPTGGQAPGPLQLQAQDCRCPRTQAVSNLHRRRGHILNNQLIIVPGRGSVRRTGPPAAPAGARPPPTWSAPPRQLQPSPAPSHTHHPILLAARVLSDAVSSTL